ncbi:PREDICTED: uncharacterized protein LOC109193913 [Ipomoea nil]|uniref:uncharacterized protein LOC109193913 n=1 Tax=Ipomoea nil TaxID=35883 RepID=UPI00090136DC|nr:PREDICTED: uncharacterized protein LOC109193913 [Ipomoea nil]
METVTESLSERSSPTATNRSPELHAPEERNPKKTKRGRDALETLAPSQMVEGNKDLLMEAELMSPEFAQWGTPTDTPIQDWAKEAVKDSFERDNIAEESEMEEDLADFNNPVIPISEEEKERIRRPWSRSLIVKVLGRRIGYVYLLQRLQNIWRPEASFELITLSQDYYIAHFESLRDYEFAKFEGPWCIMDHYVIVKEWEPNFDPYCDTTEKLLVWVRFPALPIEYFEEQFLIKIAKRVGRPIITDTTTSLISKGNFARVCLEVDISKPLRSKITLEEKAWPIEYEGLHLVCFKRGRYGHRLNQCGMKNSGGSQDQAGNTNPQNEANSSNPSKKDTHLQQQTSSRPDLSTDFGSWMLVTRRDRRGPRRGGSHPTTVRHQTPNNLIDEGLGDQSRFASLANLEKEDNGPIEEEQRPSLNLQDMNEILPRIRTNRRAGKSPVQQQ